MRVLGWNWSERAVGEAPESRNAAQWSTSRSPSQRVSYLHRLVIVRVLERVRVLHLPRRSRAPVRQLVLP